MPVDLALVNYVQDLEALFTAATGSTEIVEENKKQNVSVQSKVKPSISSHSKLCTMARRRLLKCMRGCTRLFATRNTGLYFVP